MIHNKINTNICYALLTIFFISSCGFVDLFPKETCKIVSPNFIIPVKFDSSFGLFFQNTSIWKNIQDSGYEWAQATGSDSIVFNELSRKIMKLTNTNESKNDIDDCFIFYRNGFLSNDSLLSYSSIVGISWFTHDNISKKRYHKLFKKIINNKFIEIKELHSEVNGVETDNIHNISEKIFHLSKYRSTLSFINNSNPDKINESESSNSEFENKINKHAQK